jgi:hypothetical protein
MFIVLVPWQRFVRINEMHAIQMRVAVYFCSSGAVVSRNLMCLETWIAYFSSQGGRRAPVLDP